MIKYILITLFCLFLYWHFGTDWRRIFYPTSWVQLENTSDAWDKKLNEKLDTETLKLDGAYTVYVGETSVWIGNFPYSYGYSYNRGPRLMPRLKTRLRLRRMVEELAIKEM